MSRRSMTSSGSSMDLQQRLLWLLVSSIAVCWTTSSPVQGSVIKAPLHPVILVPGDGGNWLLARRNKSDPKTTMCDDLDMTSSYDWFFLWLTPYHLLPSYMPCWVKNVKLVYDPATRTTRDSEGVETMVPGFGNTTSLEYVSERKQSYTMYFGDLVDSLVQSLGYVRAESIYGAPYDFRKAANEQEAWMNKTRDLVEAAYYSNGNKRVVLVGHSMGCSMILYLLNRQPQAWKDKFIRTFVSLAAPYGGTVRAIKVFVAGDDLGSYIVKPTLVMDAESTMPSLMWMMPSADVWDADEVFVVGNNTNAITMGNLRDFFILLNKPTGQMMWEDTEPLLRGIPAPNVEVFCWYGTGVNTTEKLVYDEYFPGPHRNFPELKDGDGDGTVNRRSLEACKRWIPQQRQPVFVREFPGTDHMQVIQNQTAVKAIVDLIATINSGSNLLHLPDPEDLAEPIIEVL